MEAIAAVVVGSALTLLIQYLGDRRKLRQDEVAASRRVRTAAMQILAELESAALAPGAITRRAMPGDVWNRLNGVLAEDPSHGETWLTVAHTYETINLRNHGDASDEDALVEISAAQTALRSLDTDLVRSITGGRGSPARRVQLRGYLRRLRGGR